MGEAKTKRKILKDGDVFSGRDVYAKWRILLDRTDDTNVVIGPIVYPLPEMIQSAGTSLTSQLQHPKKVADSAPMESTLDAA